ncbi:peptidase U32 family protein [Azohydromonas caseinilytica]|uniref:U32 family peptidase n=1 Tax=Azohydromonas caseinilytica TaxID=2728836 RepID=A0A848F728_9BURK|nr:U32 family peptidase [Azohydromonas caseinilytica]NML14515.1 U32 family peptidase [Azohydromonas caseinilytica]
MSAQHRSRQLELLSPARDADIGIEAVNHGADAVYIGGPGFGARASAGNAVADIERLTKHAHRFGAKIFVTLNTILRDDELDDARRMAWDVYHAGADALIVQDMGLLELDLPPLQLHASTQCDIRSVEKAKFLAESGFAQIVLARELTLPQIRAVADALPRETVLEFFVHGALCVAYSGQCYVSHAFTGRSANRGDCSQACRLPYTVTDTQGRIVAHDKHVLSMKDNNQSANLAALVDAGVRSFKIEGRYKDMGYVKNITAHYRRLLDEVLEQRPALSRASSGRTTFFFEPDPDRNFNRGTTDYFVNGRQDDIGAFDTPKHAGLPLGHVSKVAKDHIEVVLDEGVGALNNGDSITWFDLQQELQGVQVNTVEALDDAGTRWRVVPKEPVAQLKDLRRDTVLQRNRDMAWERLLRKKSSERRIAVDLHFEETPDGFALSLTDEDGHYARAELAHAHERAQHPERVEPQLREQLGKLGATIFEAREVTLRLSKPWFVPAGALNALRRDAVAALEAEREACRERLLPAAPVQPPVPYPEDTLSYLANVYNRKAHDFYVKHGVKVVEAAYESHEALGEASLMITKHCVRFSLSLCPKQAKGVTGVQGTVRAEPLTITHGDEVLTLRFDCKPCEMHVVGRIKKNVLQQARAAEKASLKAVPMQFYRTRPPAQAR